MVAVHRTHRREPQEQIPIGSGHRGGSVRVRLSQREFDHVLATQADDQFVRRASGDDLAVVDDGNPIAEPFRFVEIVRRDQNGPSLSAVGANDFPQLAPRPGIESRRRLIEKQEFGIADQWRQATANLCFCPPESLPTRESAFSRKFDVVDCLVRT